MDLKTIVIILLAVIAVAAEIRAELYYRRIVKSVQWLIQLFCKALDPEMTEMLSTPATPEEEQK